METNYSVDYFIKKFEDIGYLGCGLAAQCAYNQCGVDAYEYNITDEAKALSGLFEKYLSRKMPRSANNFYVGGLSNLVVSVNDAVLDNIYKQEYAKQRILAALYDIKKMSSEPEVKVCDATEADSKVNDDKIKIIHIYHKVEIPETISESLPQTVLS